MKILIDVNPLTKGKYTGIPYYGYKLIEAFLAIYKEDEVMFSWFDGGVRVEHEDVIRGLHPNGKVLINHGTMRNYRIRELLLPKQYSNCFDVADITYFFSYFLPRKTGNKSICGY